MSVARIYIVGGFAFVPHPIARGMWLRCDLSVAKAACGLCGSVVGEPCKRMSFRGDPKPVTPFHYTSGTHYPRRDAAKALPLPASNADELHCTINQKD